MLDTNPLGARIANGRIIKITNFVFLLLARNEPEVRRSETLVAGLRSVLAILQPETMTVCR